MYVEVPIDPPPPGALSDPPPPVSRQTREPMVEGGRGWKMGSEAPTQSSSRLGHVVMFVLAGVSVMVSLPAGWVAATNSRETEDDASQTGRRQIGLEGSAPPRTTLLREASGCHRTAVLGCPPLGAVTLPLPCRRHAAAHYQSVSGVAGPTTVSAGPCLVVGGDLPNRFAVPATSTFGGPSEGMQGPP